MSGTLTLEPLVLLSVQGKECSSGPFRGSQNLQWSPAPFNLRKRVYTCLVGCPAGLLATWYIQGQVGTMKPEPAKTES